MSDKNGSNLGGTGEFINIADLIAIFDLILTNTPVYVDKWNVIAKGKVKSCILTNIFGNKIVLKAEANLLIENLGDRVTIYDINAYFFDDGKKQRISATNLLINTNSCKKNDFIVLDKGDVILINIIAVLQCHNKDFSLQSLKNLELMFSGTSSSKNKIFPLQD